MSKNSVVGNLEKTIESVEQMITRIGEGDIGFSEAGDWLHNCGDDILSALENALDYIKEAV